MNKDQMKVGPAFRVRRLAFAIAAFMFAIASWSAPGYAGANSQQAQLHQLQAAFHRAGTVQRSCQRRLGRGYRSAHQRHAVALDRRRLADVGSGRGPRRRLRGQRRSCRIHPACPTPSGDPTNRGTLCTLFKYVAGSFQPANKFVSLAPVFSDRVRRPRQIPPASTSSATTSTSPSTRLLASRSGPRPVTWSSTAPRAKFTAPGYSRTRRCRWRKSRFRSFVRRHY